MAAVQKVALVTGAARPSGIGRGVCKAFTAAGWRVIAVDNQPDPAPSADYVHFMQADISRPEQVLALRQRLDTEGVSQLHALVNNAGISNPYMQTAAPAQAFQERVQRWQSYIDINLSGAFLMTEALLPLMPAKQASIIHISSTRAHQSEPDSEGYAAAKAGLIGLTHAQASSLAGKARVNCILPGWIDTSGEPGSLRQEDHAWHWTGSVGQPSDIAELCLFLADEAKAGFITGQEFVVDGGVSRRMHYPE